MNTQVWLYSALTLLVLMHLVAIPALILRKNDLADVVWGPGFPIAALGGFFFGWPGGAGQIDLRLALCFSMVAVWAFRLFLHVGIRNLSHREEDVRYNNWRKEWGNTWVWRSYLQVFVLQGLILFSIDTPLLLVMASPEKPMDLFAWAGAAIWLGGFLFESVSDEHLRRFKKDSRNKGKLLTSGLWSWSRHPNYFGEVLQWWGIFLVALPLPWGWLTVLSPLAITYLILKVSGVPMLEKLMENRAGAAEYRRRTSEFFPMPPKA